MMKTESLAIKASQYLDTLCNQIPNRRTGSPGNRMAVEFAAKKLSSYGLAIEQQAFDCLDWEHGAVHLSAEGETFEAYPSSYSLGFREPKTLASPRLIVVPCAGTPAPTTSRCN